jgi:hypothetical protein
MTPTHLCPIRWFKPYESVLAWFSSRTWDSIVQKCLPNFGLNIFWSKSTWKSKSQRKTLLWVDFDLLHTMTPTHLSLCKNRWISMIFYWIDLSFTFIYGGTWRLWKENKSYKVWTYYTSISYVCSNSTSDIFSGEQSCSELWRCMWRRLKKLAAQQCVYHLNPAALFTPKRQARSVLWGTLTETRLFDLESQQPS